MADVNIDIELNTKEAERSLKKYDKTLNQTIKDTKSLGTNTTSAESSLVSIGAKATVAAAAIAGIGKALSFAVESAIQIEDLTTQFIAFTGSAEAARRQVEAIADFSASTPFQLDELAAANRTLLAFGSNTEESLEQLRQLGEAAAATGADIGDLATIFGQIQAAGKLTGERFNQLVERGINIGPALANSLGVAESSLELLRRQGKITSEDVQRAFAEMTSEGGVFFGSTERLSKTLSGSLSTLDDNFTALAGTIGQGFTPIIVELSNATAELLKEINQDIKGFLNDDELQRNAAQIETVTRQINNLEQQIKASVSAVENAESPVVKFFSLFTGDPATEVAGLRDELSKLKEDLAGLESDRQTLIAPEAGGGPAAETAAESEPAADPARVQKIADIERQITEVRLQEEAVRQEKLLQAVQVNNEAALQGLISSEQALAEKRIELEAQKLEAQGMFAEAALVRAVELEEQKQQAVIQREIEGQNEKTRVAEEGEQKRLEAIRQAQKEQFDIEKQTAIARRKFDEQTYAGRVSTASKGLQAIANLQKSGNQDAFRVGKAAAIAQAGIAIPTTAIEAYKSLAGIPIVGPALGAAAAVAAVAAGVAQLNQIKSQTFTAFEEGGVVPGNRNRIDSVPALLTPGEVVVPEKNFQEIADFRLPVKNLEELANKQDETNSLLRTIAFQEGEAFRLSNIANSSTPGGVFYEPVEFTGEQSEQARRANERFERLKNNSTRSSEPRVRYLDDTRPQRRTQ